MIFCQYNVKKKALACYYEISSNPSTTFIIGPKLDIIYTIYTIYTSTSK